MINLIPYSDVNFDLLGRIFRAKQRKRRKRLAKIEPKVVAACTDYGARTAAMEGIVTGAFGAQQRRDLLHCYNVRSTPLNTLKAAIKQAQPTDECQYCGIGPARSIDHYLPRESFHEFSVFSGNLVPCCKDCNELKRALWLVGGQRQIVNLYYDHWPATRFLEATVTATANSFRAQFTLAANGAAYGGMRALIEAHFENLHLLDRYAAASRRALPEARRLARIYARRHDEAGAAVYLRDYAQGLAADESVNYWKAVMIEAASACPGFCAR